MEERDETDYTKISFNSLKNEVMERARFKHNYLRLGQFVFNYIHWKYGVAKHIRFEEGIDCYNNDALIDYFLLRSVDMINKQK